MNVENQLIKAITGKSVLAETTREDWQQLLVQYPAFGIGQYLFAKKLAAESDAEATKQRQIAAIHFNDLRWLDYLLEQNEVSEKEPTAASEKWAASENEIALSEVDGDQLPAGQQVEEPTKSPTVAPQPEPDVMNAAEISSTEPTGPPDTTATTISEDLPDNHRISSLVSAQLADFNKPVTEDVPLELSKEPLYKIDYFASQGIILGKSQDELDKKVKKFTDWLKDMKQSGQTTPHLQTTPQEEDLIMHKAAASLQSEAVFTESMAEVLLQQGKRAQAKEVYQKLSLLYPEKTSYFASKIDSLQQ